MKWLKAITMAVAGAGLAATTAYGATQGSIGNPSTGTAAVQAQINALVRITDLNDLDLGSFTGSALSGSDDVCVWSNNGGYIITATSTNGTGSFLLNDGSGNTVAYSVAWAESAGAGSGTSLTEGTASAAFTGTSFQGPTCASGANLNATLLIDISDTDLAGPPSGTYTDTLTLQVEPQ